MKSLPKNNFIAGHWLSSTSSKKIASLDKYTQEQLIEVEVCDDALIEKALERAHLAAKIFKHYSAEKKAQLLQSIHSKIQENKETFVDLLIREAGKPRRYATAEVERSLLTLELSAAEALRFAGEVVPMDYSVGTNKLAMTLMQASGPVFCMTPFNFPLNLLMHKLGPAFAVGCPVVVKPSPYTPAIVQFLATLLDELALPEGFFSLINVEVEQVRKIVEDSRVKIVSFTGSAAVGWEIKKFAHNKKVVLELGGSAAGVVFENSNWKKAAAELAISSYMYAGQVCISTQRIFVEESIYPQFKEQLCEEIKKISWGNPALESTVIGPLIDKAHLARITQWISEAQGGGAKILLEGEIDHDRCLMSPYLVTGTKSTMKLRSQEVFGPLAVLESFRDEKEAFELVNEGPFGLQVGIYTDSLEVAKRAAKELDIGGIILNSPASFRVDSMPYGGMKDSGFGREGVKYAMAEFCDMKLLVM